MVAHLPNALMTAAQPTVITDGPGHDLVISCEALERSDPAKAWSVAQLTSGPSGDCRRR